MSLQPRNGRIAQLLGFAYRYIDGRKMGERHARFRVPYWPLTVAALMWALFAWRRRASSDLLCPTCGYDLRATPPGGRCPE